MDERPKVLLAAGLDTDGAARLPKMFADAGSDVTVISPPAFRVARSRYVGRHVPCDDRIDAVLAATRAEIARQTFRMVVLTSDPLLYAVYADPNKEWIAPYLPIQPGAPCGDIVSSKNKFLETCSRAGVPVPAYRLCANLADALAAAEELGYPVVLKLSEGYAGLGVRIVRNSDELRGALASSDWHGLCVGEFAVQRFIEGRVGTTSVLYDRGTPVRTASAFYLRCWPTPLSPPTVREITHRRELLEIAAQFGSLTDYRGLGGIDWIEERSSGEIFVLEMNVRPTPMHVIAPALSGYSAALHALLHHTEIPPLRPPGRHGERYSAFPGDVCRAIAQRDIAALLQWLVLKPFGKSIPLDDPPLFRAQCRHIFQMVRRQLAWIVSSRLKKRHAPRTMPSSTLVPVHADRRIDHHSIAG